MPRNDTDLELAVKHATLNRVERRHMQVQTHVGRPLGKARDG